MVIPQNCRGLLYEEKNVRKDKATGKGGTAHYGDHLHFKGTIEEQVICRTGSIMYMGPAVIKEVVSPRDFFIYIPYRGKWKSHVVPSF